MLRNTGENKDRKKQLIHF